MPLVVAIVVLWCATGCAHGVRHVKAVDVLSQPCEAAAQMSRLLQVIVTDESGTRLPGAFITATWRDTTRTFLTDANGRAEVEAKPEPAKLHVQLSGFAPVEITDATVEQGCRATLFVPLAIRVDCRHAECG
jgi:hypothetical protein